MTGLLTSRLIPAPLHRWLLRGAHRLRVAWWRCRRPLALGVSIIARDGGGRVLLIRQSYGSRDWNLPGGGIRSGEDPAEAAAREFTEELGCPITAVQPLTIRDEALHGATNRVHVFTACLAGEPRPDGREVIAAQLFALHALPVDLGRRAKERLALLPEDSPALGERWTCGAWWRCLIRTRSGPPSAACGPATVPCRKGSRQLGLKLRRKKGPAIRPPHQSPPRAA